MKIIAKTLEGLEQILADEIRDIGGENIEILNRAVAFTGDITTLYKANLLLRTTIKVLVFLKEFQIRNENDLYDEVMKLPWEDYFSLDQTFAIDSVVNSSQFNHANFISLKTKDAIVDRFRQKFGSRPSVDTTDPHLKINVQIRENTVALSFDSSGTSLHMRGYRRAQVDAPMNEVLAAGLVLISGWKGETPLIDPMCGSGTILCEAVKIAANMPPQSFDRNFAFKKWKTFDETMWNLVCENAQKQINLSALPKIQGFDILPKAVKASQINVETAGLEKYIEIAEEDFFYQEGTEDASLIFNPPYDERLRENDVTELYRQIGDKLKLCFTNCDVWIISGHLEAMKNVGLRPSVRKKMLNGSIQSLYCKYEMYKGTKKSKWINKYGNAETNN